MGELQALLTGWLAELAAVLPFGFAFGVGMVAAVNPCGFAMLPAYLSLYLGAHEEDFGKRHPMTRLLRALLVGATVSSGFVVLFGLAGLIISAGGSALLGVMPALGIVIGGVLYGPGLTWDEGPPRPISSGYTVYGAREELKKNMLPLLE